MRHIVLVPLVLIYISLLVACSSATSNTQEAVPTANAGAVVIPADRRYELSYGASLNNNYATNERHSYVFFGIDGDLINLHVQAVDSSSTSGFAPNVFIYSPNGNVLQSYDTPYGRDDIELEAVLPVSGTYTILLYDAQDNIYNRDDGTYNIRLSLVRSRPTGMATLSLSATLPAFELGEITVNDAPSVSVFDLDEISLPNCGGAADLTVRRNITKTRERTLSLNATAGVSFDLGFVTTSLQAALGISDGETLSDSTEIEMTAPPGYSVTYHIEWREVSQTGVVAVQRGDEITYVEFSVNRSIEAQISEPAQNAC